MIKLQDDGKRIEYIEQKKSRLYTNPEEQVQAEAAQILADAKTEVERMILGE